MREILFRGKRKRNGEWVDGDLRQFNPYGLNYVNGKDKATFIIADERANGGIEYEVIPETIGQYTGLTDKNKKKIFEGDIGRYKQTDGAKINGKPIICIGKVVYNEKTASFAVDSKDEIGAKNYDYFPIKDFEIIGNIHDNPELLKGGE